MTSEMMAILTSAGAMMATTAGAAVVVIKSSFGHGRRAAVVDHHHDMIAVMNQKLDSLPAIARDAEQAKNFGAANARHIAHIYETLSIRPPSPSWVDANGEGGAR